MRKVFVLFCVSGIVAGSAAADPANLEGGAFIAHFPTGMEFSSDPPAGGWCQEYWDHFRIEQIIINLLSNAAKYGERKPVHVSLGRENGRAVLRVVDHGLGIAPEHQKRIFEQFERAVPSRKISGLGLGLFIASQIAEGHGGTIRVESAPGQGSTFTVELPVWALLG